MSEDGIEGIATELAGVNPTAFFALYVHGTDHPPLAELLGRFGITHHLRSSEGSIDRGGKSRRTGNAGEPGRSWLGASLSGGPHATLQHDFSGGPTERAGLAAGDVVIDIDGLRMSADAIERLHCRRRAGETLPVHAFRRDELIRTALTLAAAPDDTCWITLDNNADAATRARRTASLGRDG